MLANIEILKRGEKVSLLKITGQCINSYAIISNDAPLKCFTTEREGWESFYETEMQKS